MRTIWINGNKNKLKLWMLCCKYWHHHPSFFYTLVWYFIVAFYSSGWRIPCLFRLLYYRWWSVSFFFLLMNIVGWLVDWHFDYHPYCFIDTLRDSSGKGCSKLQKHMVGLSALKPKICGKYALHYGKRITRLLTRYWMKVHSGQHDYSLWSLIYLVRQQIRAEYYTMKSSVDFLYL